MIQIRNHTGQCCHPDCSEPVPETELLCPEHKRLSERADLRLKAIEYNRYNGPQWPETQLDVDDV